MALHFYWRCESATLTTDVDFSADMSGNNSIAFTFDSAAARVGTNGLVGTSGVTGSVYFSTGDIFPNYTEIQGSAGSLGFWVRYVSSVPGNSIQAGFRAYTDASANSLAIEGSTGSKLRLKLGSYSLPCGAALSTNTWYFVVARWDIPGDKAAIEIYDNNLDPVSGAAAEDTATDLSAVFTSAAVTILQCGQRGTTATVIHTDNFIISTSYNAPLIDNALITDKDSYTESVAPTITAAPSELSPSFNYTVTGTNFGASQGVSGNVYVAPTDSIADANKVTQTIVSWSDTSITFTATRGSLNYNTNMYLFVKENGGTSNASGSVLQFKPGITLSWSA